MDAPDVPGAAGAVGGGLGREGEEGERGRAEAKALREDRMSFGISFGGSNKLGFCFFFHFLVFITMCLCLKKENVFFLRLVVLRFCILWEKKIRQTCLILIYYSV